MNKMTTVCAGVLALGAIHCAASDVSTEASNVKVDDGIEPATILPSSHCWAEIERPIPGDMTQALGTTITLKTGGAICPLGVNEKVAYRFYVEKIDVNGRIISPRKSPQGPNEWSLTKSTFDTSVLDGPGRYRIYAFSIPRQYITAWQANDVAARALPRRTGNAIVNFVTTSWDTGSFGSCSATCGGGTQTRTVTCKDNNGVTRADSWCLTTKPATSQACNEDACPVGQTPNSITLHGSEDFMLTNTSEIGSETTWMIGPPMCWWEPFMGMWCDPGMPFPINTPVYWVKGYWDDPETTARVDVKITFASKPTSEGDFTMVSSTTPGATQAYVVVQREVPGVGSYTYSGVAGDAVIKVRTGADTKLHVLLDDASLGNGTTAQVKADLAVEP